MSNCLGKKLRNAFQLSQPGPADYVAHLTMCDGAVRKPIRVSCFKMKLILKFSNWTIVGAQGRPWYAIVLSH